MKDPHDKRTVDGFGDLLRGLDEPSDEVPPTRPGVALSDLAKLLDNVAEQRGIELPKAAEKAKPGPKPKGEKTMSGAERAKRFRENRRAQRDAERSRLAAEKPTSSIIDLSSDLRSALLERK